MITHLPEAGLVLRPADRLGRRPGHRQADRQHDQRCAISPTATPVVQVPGVGRGDEVGDMASAVQVFKDNAIEKIRLEEEQAAAARAPRKRSARP